MLCKNLTETEKIAEKVYGLLHELIPPETTIVLGKQKDFYGNPNYKYLGKKTVKENVIHCYVEIGIDESKARKELGLGEF